jgi:hypothetical protein
MHVYFTRKLYRGIGTNGSLCLNNSVGGQNAEAVEIAPRRDAREIWIPTFDSAHQIAQLKKLINPPTAKENERGEANRSWEVGFVFTHRKWGDSC